MKNKTEKILTIAISTDLTNQKIKSMINSGYWITIGHHLLGDIIQLIGIDVPESAKKKRKASEQKGTRCQKLKQH